MDIIKGVVCKDRFTKVLIQKIDKNNIAVIKHRAIDLVAAQDLKYKKVKAVINCEKTIDEERSLDGIKYLMDNNIGIYEVYDKNFFHMVHNGDCICLYNDMVFVNNIFYTYYAQVKRNEIAEVFQRKKHSDIDKNRRFIRNTMNFMESELDYFINDKDLPDLDVNLKNKDIVIISRGRGYREDLKAIKKYIINKKPVLISVDGGADAVTDIGLKSDIIIGDMDSVSNKSLFNCREILVHTYSDGYAPGLKRIKAIGLNYKLIQLKGTSEDAAIYMAKLKGVSTIYLIGSHTGIDEFLEKDRCGMGSTVLLRVLMGTKIIDLKGISNITKYNSKNYLHISMFVFFSFLLVIAVFSYKELLEFIQANIKVIINMR